MANKPTAMKNDAIGNPTTWYDGTTFTWVNGRRLASATNTAENLTATYGSEGLRLTKTINGVEHKYLWQGSKLVSEYYNGKELEFFYDESGSPYAFSYKSSSTATPITYYLTNLLGDIVGILDSSGATVASYTYNAWGKLLSSSGSMADVNPLRYRGYYYDAETGFYYVSSRYYDPEIGRFVNADDTAYLGADGTPLSYNLFSYCQKNPVMGYDPIGTFDWGSLAQGGGWLATGVAALVVGVSVLTCGVATPLMVGVALATAGTGALTVVNGASEIGEAFTGYNVMRDGLFQGNANAYNTYAYSTATVAQVGTAICGGWMSKNSPRINAYKSMDSYNVKYRHLPSTGGDWSKFNTTSQAELRALGQEALKNTPMSSLLPNSADSYAAIYNFGRVIGTAGQTNARLVFSTAGKIITFFPQ